MQDRCLDLDDPRARDASIVGAKAAGLAVAPPPGLPVLPGVVVPVAESAGVVAAVTGALDGGSGGRARLAAMKVRPDEQLLDELRTRLSGFPAPLIVRSSSPLESDGTWSGAFSSFHGVGTEDLGTAVRGCWGSAFSVGVLDRAEGTGTDPSALGLAVLVQPELHPDLGGTARLLPDGTVRITATRGPLLPLMEGNVEGELSTVATDDTVTGPSPDDAEVLLEVARLSRRVGEVLDHQLIEWAATGGAADGGGAAGQVHLLQSIRSVAPAATPRPDHEAHPELGSEVAVRVAVLTQRFPGKLADELLLPWAVAVAPDSLPVPPSPITTGEADPVAAFAAARALASSLTAVAWGGSPRSAAADAERVLRQLRGDAPAAAIARLSQLSAPGREPIAELLGHLETVRAALRSSGVLDHDAAFWRLSADDVARAVRGDAVPAATRFGVERWEPFVHAVVSLVGTAYSGTPAAPGAGAGRAHLVDDANTQPSPEGRYVLVASEPGPALGPLLWNAAGLVTRAGSTAAHLIEFAHSIGVPTVVGCDLPRIDPAGPAPLLAVDGDLGRVSVAAVTA